MLNDADNSSSRLNSMRARVLFFAVNCNLYFDNHRHSLQFGLRIGLYIFGKSLLHSFA